MTSSQRIMKYTEIESEDLLVKEGDKNLSTTPGKNWPHLGAIEFKNASMRYRDTLEPSINNLTFKVEP